MSWDLLIGGVLTALGTALGAIIGRWGIKDQIAHEREMRLVDERLAIVRQLIDLIAFTEGLMFKKLRKREVFPKEAIFTDEETTITTNGFMKMQLLSYQLGDERLGASLDTFTGAVTQLMVDFVSRTEANEAYRVSVGELERDVAAFHSASNVVGGEIARVSGIAVQQKAEKPRRSVRSLFSSIW